MATSLQITKKHKVEQLDQLKENHQKLCQNVISLANNANPQQTTLEGYILLSQLKELNRNAFLELEQTKDTVHDELEQSQELSLRLANVQYEITHVKNEIQTNIQAQQTLNDSSLERDLITEEEINSELEPQATDHERMLSRLTHEIKERKRLISVIQELREKQKVALEANSTQKKFMQGLSTRLQSLNQTSLPLQQYLSLSVSKKFAQSQLAYKLPQPLYNLYFNACIYAESQEKDTVSVSIQESSNKKDESNSASNVAKEFQPGPTAVLVELHKTAPALTLTFDYLPALHVLTVSVTGPVNARNLLVHLFPHDSGKYSANHAMTLNSPDRVLFPPQLHRRPYKWVQWLGGLDFLPRSTEKRFSLFATFETVIAQIVRRMTSWAALKVQIDALRKGQLPSSSSARSFCKVIIGTEAGWSEICDQIPERTERGIKEYFKFLKLVFQKDKDQFTTYISISPEYPLRSPQFTLLTNSGIPAPVFPPAVVRNSDPNALKQAATSGSHCAFTVLKQIESEVNSIGTGPEAPDHNLLSLQVKRLHELLENFPKIK